jgi:putative ABC transport system permease protein
MSDDRWLARSERWFRVLLRLYPADFRDEMGDALVEAYRDRCRAALARGGVASLLGVWLVASGDSLRNGVGERLAPAVSWRRGGNWARDTEMAVRRLVRAPLFTAAMIGTLTVGLGAFAMVYTVVHKVLLAPLPYRNPEDLYFVWRNYEWVHFDRGWVAGTDVAELRKVGGQIEQAVALQRYGATLTGTSDTRPAEIGVMSTSPELFDLLGVRPALGRLFRPDEGGPGRAPVAVLTHALWNRLGADSAIVGSAIRIDGAPYTVIGVLGRTFEFVRHSSLGQPEGADVYTTLDVDLAATDPRSGNYAVLVRARPGTTPAALAAAVAAAGRVVDERDFQGRGLRLYPAALGTDLVAGVRPALTALGLAGVLLLLVLMVNLATLLLARAMQRERELAVLRALGANRAALTRATLLEGALLGALGSAAGALVAVWGTRVLVGLTPLELPRRDTIVVDWQIGLVVIGVGALLGLVAASAPALWAGRTRLSALMSSTTVRGGGARGRLRRSLVVMQVALSLVLLSAGALVVRSFDHLLRTNPGFDPGGVLTLRVPVADLRYPNDTAAIRLHERLERELGTIPGVTAVGAASALPLSRAANQTDVAFPGAPGNTGEPDHDRPLVDYVNVRPGFFEALGVRLLAGRAFAGPRPAGVHEAIVDRQIAESFFPNTTPVGATMRYAGDTLTIVGLVDHLRLYDVHRNGRAQVFLRNDDAPVFSSLSFAVRTTRPPESLAPDVLAAVRRVDPELAVADLRPMESLIADSLRQQRLSAVLIGGFSLGALLLASMGLFGVVAGSVTRRRHELAVRLAMGADHRRLLGLVVGEGALLIAAGFLIGAPGVYLAGRLIRGVLVGVSASDPLTLVLVALGLGTVAVLACYLPARRVAGIEPAQSLRDG